MTAVTILDSSAAWASATRMVGANRDLLVAIAGVFFLLPWLAGAVLVPPMPQTLGLSEAQVFETMQSYYASTLPVLLPFSLLPMAGMLTMLFVMMDGARPTVAQAIRRSVGALPIYLAAQLLIGLVILLISIVLTGVLALVLPDRVAASVALGTLLYPIMRTLLVSPVLAGQAERNPLTAIRRSIQITHGNAGRILVFFALAGLVFLVVYGLAMMFVSVVLVLIAQGEPQRFLAEVVDCALRAVGYTYFVAMLAAVYGQFAGPEQGTRIA